MSAALDEGGPALYARLRRAASTGDEEARYTVLGELAQGGMGRVLRVWDEHLQRELAMKEMSVPDEADGGDNADIRREQLIARFVEEARINGQLDHPGIVPVHDIAVDDEGRLYFTMPLVRGYDLTRVFVLLREGKEGWTLHRALNVLLKVTLAVAYAHSKGVIHRDLKPSNVMVGPFGETYVVDWGLAMIVGRSGRRGIVGTPAYMAPEQAGVIEGEVGPRSDVYSLGAILYHLCTGLMPHESSLREGSTGDGLLVEPPRPLHEIDSSLPPELVAICEKAMAWEPNRRYSSALGLAEDLRAWLEGRVVSAYDSSTMARLKKWRERNRGLSMALEAICVLMLVSIAAVIWLQRNKLTAVAAAHRRTVHENYAANLLGAELGLKLFNAQSAKASLNACATEHRGWEWSYLALCSDLSLTTFTGQEEILRAVAVDPGGGRLAAASDDHTIRIWDLDTGLTTLELIGHTGSVNDLTFDSEGKRIASASADHKIRIWNADDGNVEAELRASALIRSLAMSPDDAHIAGGDHGGTIRIWDVATGEIVQSIGLPDRQETEVMDVGWGPDGARLYAAYNDSLRVWDAATGELLAERRGEGAYFALAVGPAGSLVAAAHLSGQVRLLDAASLEPLRTLSGHEGLVRSVAFDASGTRLVTGAIDRTVAVWDVETGSLLTRFLGHTDTVNAVAFLPDANRFVSGSADRSARLWDVSAAATHIIQAPGALPDPIALSPNGRLLASPQVGAVLLIDSQTGGVVTEVPVDVTVENLVFSPDGLQLACSAKDRITVHDVATGEKRAEFPAGLNVRAMAFSPDGTELLSRSHDQLLRLTDIETGVARLLIDYSGGVPMVERRSPPRGLAFAPDGQSFAVGMLSGRIDLIDSQTGELRQRLEGHTDWINSIAFGFDGNVLLSCSADGEAVLWDLTTGEAAATFGQHAAGVAAAVFIDEGRRVVTSSFANEVRVWDTGTGKQLLSLPFGDLHVVAVGFDEEAGRLVAASTDHRVRSWLSRPTRD